MVNKKTTPSQEKIRRVYILVGESSGDLHAAGVVKELQKLAPQIQFFGTGGANLKACQVNLSFHVQDLAVMGFTEILPKFFFFWRVFRKVKQEIKNLKPDLVLLVDYPGFNLRLAKAIKKKFPHPVVYFIPPSVWAWKEERAELLKAYCDKIIGIFPFEKDFYQKKKIAFQYFGNPLAYQLRNYPKDPTRFRKNLGLDAHQKIVCLLPGSRSSAIKKSLPIFQQLAKELKKEKIFFVWCLSINLNQKDKALFDFVQKEPNQGLKIGENWDCLAHSDFSICAGSTASLESSLLGCPYVLVYQASAFSYGYLKKFYPLPYFSLPNICLGRSAFAEYVQENFTSGNLKHEILHYFSDLPHQKKLSQAILELKNLLQVEETPYRLVAQCLFKDFLKKPPQTKG